MEFELLVVSEKMPTKAGTVLERDVLEAQGLLGLVEMSAEQRSTPHSKWSGGIVWRDPTDHTTLLLRSSDHT